jgi:hypothetical protein
VEPSHAEHQPCFGVDLSHAFSPLARMALAAAVP